MVITLAFSNDRTHAYNLVKALSEKSSDFSIVEIDVAWTSPVIPIGRENMTELLDNSIWEHTYRTRKQQSFASFSDVLLATVKPDRGRFKNETKTLKEIIEAWYHSPFHWIFTGVNGLTSGDVKTKNLIRIARRAPQLSYEQSEEVGYAEIITADYQTSGAY